MYLSMWTAFLPLLLFTRKRPVHPVSIYLWTWLLVMIVFFSCSKAKAIYYLMPGAPALAMLLA